MESNQIILINKPLRWTSFDVVKKVRNVLSKAQHTHAKNGTGLPAAGQFGPQAGLPAEALAQAGEVKTHHFKIGHAGTLDPLATGLLVLCTGNFTKKITEIQSAEKEYTGSIIIGSTTPSYDLETEVSEEKNYGHVTEELIMKTAVKFTGKQLQTPPAHSAIKIGGIRAYMMARKGQSVEIVPKEVDIKEFEITGIDLPRIDLRVVCSKGTYIRSLAHDFGKELGCGAHLSALCRTRIGEYLLKNAFEMDDFIGKYTSETNFSRQIESF